MIDSRILFLKKSDLEQPNSFEKKNGFGSLTFTDFKAYYKAIVIKIVCEQYKEEIPEINPCICNQMILTGWQEFSVKDEQSLQQMVLEKLDIHMQKNDIVCLLYTINEN